MPARKKAPTERYPQPIYETRQVIVGWRCKCIWDGKIFTAKRRDAKLCSNACKKARQRALRAKQKAPRGRT